MSDRAGAVPLTPALFRWLIVASLLIAVAGSTIDMVWPSLMPEPLAYALDEVRTAQEWDMPATLLTGALMVVLIAGLAAMVALYQFRAWGRSLSLWGSVISFPLLLWSGPEVASSWASVLLDVSMMLWGAVMAAAYWGPLATRFEQG